MRRHTTFGFLGFLLLIGLMIPATAYAEKPTVRAKPRGMFSQGRMNVGLGAGGGDGMFTVSGSYGYFVIDGLRPGIAVQYTYQKQPNYSSNEVQGEFSLRYYLMEPNPIAPFVVADTSVINLSYSGDFNEEYTYYSVGGGGGVFMRAGKHMGFEVMAGAVKYLGVDSVLTELGAVPKGVSFRWSIGLAFFF